MSGPEEVHPQKSAHGTVTWTRSGWAMHTTNVLDAKLLPDSKQVNEKRSVEAEVLDPGWQRIEGQTYKISAPDEEGDGTVPHRSGVVPKAVCKSFMQVSVGHEPAYKASEGADNLRACRFTLRAIVKIAQQVTQTSLKYE